jgi:hypothetical protein|tara:strand:+ start:2116 stop:2295 length:180 start_codon:yes stop_codon:yes gene_type:complete
MTFLSHLGLNLARWLLGRKHQFQYPTLFSLMVARHQYLWPGSFLFGLIKPLSANKENSW